MKKEDFTHGNKKIYIENNYVCITDNYTLIIDEDIFDDETIEYANNIIRMFTENKDEIIDKICNLGITEFYSNRYNCEYIKNNLGKPQISILFKNNRNPKYKFNFAGEISFLEHKLDEHILSIEFKDNLDFVGKVGFDV